MNDILDFSKIEAGKFTLEFRPFRLRDDLGDTMKSLGVRAQQKNLEVIFDVQSEVADALIGDSGRLRQVLTNLVGNAIKFTDEGEVAVRVSQESQQDGQVVLQFAVKDTGIGIPADKHQQVFEAFVQADSSTTRKYGGTGLGLAIASRLVELMGGKIWLESTVGRGSTFYFTCTFGLPVESLLADEPVDDLQGVSVLVVDDNESQRRLLERILTAWGMHATGVPDTSQAMDELDRRAAAGQRYSLVLLDQTLPGKAGLAMAEEIQKQPHLAGAVVTMVTPAGPLKTASLYRQLGVAAYVTKPIKTSELLHVLRAARGALDVEGPLAPRLAALPDQQRRSLHVLLAEDNPVNRLLGVSLLERYGHIVVAATNGRDALRALESNSFDLILMDVQMPEINGLETTGLIRTQEKETGRHIPIIAMTAHAMKGDRERCLAAGMDAYISKPIQTNELFQTITALIPQLPHQPLAETEPVLPDGLDPTALLAQVGNKPENLRKLIAVFQKEAGRLTTEIRTALDQGEFDQVRQAAHSLKGAVGVFGVPAALRAAERLETAGRAASRHDARESLAALEEQLERLYPALGNLAQASVPAVSGAGVPR
jgi:CheY-like chemotaxis protein/HPt (histidine-containing phosphotransfer) domain-containing protein